jgi:hypothetical protein
MDSCWDGALVWENLAITLAQTRHHMESCLLPSRTAADQVILYCIGKGKPVGRVRYWDSSLMTSNRTLRMHSPRFSYTSE